MRGHCDASDTIRDFDTASENGPMILSYQPCFVGDHNLICAGRQPDDSDRAALSAASAVILPQGCPAALYAMAAKHCRHRFPNFDARFAHAGKLGQIRLFRKSGLAHPTTALFESVADFCRQTGTAAMPAGLEFTLVFKFNWGGEGFTVYRIETRAQLEQQIAAAARFEQAGQRGFMLQALVSTGGRVLRVVRIGALCVPYWRVVDGEDQFNVSRSRGARIDRGLDSALQRQAVAQVVRLGRATGINLAGFDLIFDRDSARPQPLMLEINYFFGREGLGGSARYYRLLNDQIGQWLAELGLKAPAAASGRCV